LLSSSDNDLNMKKTLVCTGFHRSATSATANLLYNAGLDMGSDLMVGNVSNPKGHFEDWTAVRLHDQQLARNNTNWQMQNKQSLHTEPKFLDGYIANRSLASEHWGVKDPRACLFLEDWNNSLGSQGCFLFVIRHWSSCIESLLNRHSRDFAYHLPSFQADCVPFQFWVEPELAAKMWLLYNSRILAFIQQYPNKVLIASQRALFEGAPILVKLNEQFGFNLNVDAKTPFDNRLLNEKASQNISKTMSHGLQIKLENLWEQLLASAAFRASDESPLFYTPTSVPTDFTESLFNKMRAQIQEKGKERPQHKETQMLCFNFPKSPTIEKISSWLKDLSPNSISEERSKNIENFINTHTPTNSSIWLQFGILNLQANLYKQCIPALMKTITLGEYYPYISMHIAKCYQNLNNETQAEYFFEKAIKDNPKNPLFYISKADFYLSQSNHNQAENCLNLGIGEIGFIPQLVIKLASLYLGATKADKAQHVLTQCVDTQNPGVIELLTQVKIQKEAEDGLKSYKKNVAERIRHVDRIEWLASHSQLIDSANAESDFIHRCHCHWAEL